MGGLLCGVLCGVFCPYPVSANEGASSKLLATRISAGISFLRSISLITEPLSRNRRRTTRISPYAAPTMFALQLLDLVCALLLAVGLRFPAKIKSVSLPETRFALYQLWTGLALLAHSQ